MSAVKSNAPDVAIVVGLTTIVVGCGLLSIALGLIVGGLVLVGLGFLAGGA